MQELQAALKDCLQGPQSRRVALRVLCLVETGFDHLNIPVAELVPDEIVDLLNGDTQFKPVHVVRDIADHIVKA